MKDHAFEVMKISKHSDCLIPVWYLEKPKAGGTMTCHQHFPHCISQCNGHDKIYPEYSITYDRRVVLHNDAIHIGSLVQSTPSMLDQLPKQYHE